MSIVTFNSNMLFVHIWPFTLPEIILKEIRKLWNFKGFMERKCTGTALQWALNDVNPNSDSGPAHTCTFTWKSPLPSVGEEVGWLAQHCRCHRAPPSYAPNFIAYWRPRHTAKPHLHLNPSSPMQILCIASSKITHWYLSIISKKTALRMLHMLGAVQILRNTG